LKQKVENLISHAKNLCVSSKSSTMSVYGHFETSEVARSAIISAGRPTFRWDFCKAAVMALPYRKSCDRAQHTRTSTRAPTRCTTPPRTHNTLMLCPPSAWVWPWAVPTIGYGAPWNAAVERTRLSRDQHTTRILRALQFTHFDWAPT
jgi:hypothetical protein